MERDDRVAYVYYMLEEVKTRAFIYKFIEALGITSKSTAERTIKKLDMNKQLFLAAYTPVKSDSKAVEEVLGGKTDKVSSEVKEEPVSNILEEIAAKNEELHKELHTSKNVIETLQKGIEELNETVTESKIAIAEVCKERDDKEEEIRVLSLDLLLKDKNMDKLVEDFRELETKYNNLLEVKNLDITLNPKYDSLYKVLLAAYNQASCGKGKERHQLNDEESFEDQKICEIARRLSVDYNLGQAVKKIYESKRLTDGRDIAELYGAINYIAAAIIVKQEDE